MKILPGRIYKCRGGQAVEALGRYSQDWEPRAIRVRDYDSPNFSYWVFEVGGRFCGSSVEQEKDLVKEVCQ